MERCFFHRNGAGNGLLLNEMQWVWYSAKQVASKAGIASDTLTAWGGVGRGYKIRVSAGRGGGAP